MIYSMRLKVKPSPAIARFCIAALVGLGAPALAKAQTTASGQDIVVHAQKPLARDPAEQMIATVARESHDQLARFNDPVCPTALGLTPEFNARIEAYFRTTAADVGARIDTKTCEPNILIIVTDQPASAVKKMRYQGRQDGADKRFERELASAASAVAWNSTALENEDGEVETAQTFIRNAPTLPVRTATILGTSSQVVLRQAFVIISAKAAVGKTPAQLADYAVMRTLADTNLAPTTAKLDTILTLFDEGADPPAGLSAFDRQYLSALYRIRPNQTIVEQKSEMLARMTSQTEAKRPAQGK